MPVGDLLDHLHDVLVDGDDRLRAIARGSYALLDDDEAAVYRRLAVLDGPVGLPLVRQVVSGGPIAPVRVVRILRELTARGLLAVDRTGARWRYHQDDDLHRFARELLVEAARRTPPSSASPTPCAPRCPTTRGPPAPFRDAITDMLGSVRSLFGAAIEAAPIATDASNSPSACTGTGQRPTWPRAGTGCPGCSLAVRTAVDAVRDLRHGLPRLLVG